MALQENTEVMAYSDEQREDFKAMLTGMVVLNPKISSRKAAATLSERFNLQLTHVYVNDILKEIHEERTRRYLDISKDAAMAQMEDLTNILMQMLREIIQQEEIVFKGDNGLEKKIFAQRNRIEAIKAIFAMSERVMNLKMDLGIFERNLGRFKGDIRYVDMIKALQEYRAQNAEAKGADIQPPSVS